MANLLTGKTHQLRVACKSLGAPVLGDATYAGAAAAGEDRAYLHAAAIRIRLPPTPPPRTRLASNGKGGNRVQDVDGDGDDGVEDDSTIVGTPGRARVDPMGRAIQIVCKPTEGIEWCTDAFEAAWREVGFGEAEGGAAQEWFPGSKLLMSSLDDF